MITIKIDTPQKLTPTHFSPSSGFVSFSYDSNVVQAVRELSTRVYIPESKTWEIPLNAIPTLCNNLPNYAIEIMGEMVKKQTTLQNVLPQGYSFKTQPFNHQLEGVLYGLNHNTFLLGDEQGLGKTKQIIDLAIIKKQTEGIKHCLIICGVNGNKYNWENEIATHSNEKSWILGTRYRKRTNKAYEGTSQEKLDDLKALPNSFFLITNIETLRQLSKREGKKVIYPIADKINELVKNGQIGMIAFDECHKAKNPESKQGKALLKLNAKYMIAMSGTPLMNNPLDLYVPLKWLGYEEHTFYQYKQHYCVMGGFNDSEIVGYKNLGELKQVVDTIMLRRLKKEVLDLPPKISTIEYVDMYAEQEKIYDEVKAEIKENINKIRISNNPLAQMIRLRQATGYPGILSSTIKESAKMDRMVELVDEIVDSGDKCIIFSNWEQVTLVAKEKLKHYNPGYITGEVDANTRMNEITRFQNSDNCNVIIGTIGSMGTGITLNEASYVIFLDEPWNRALKDQAEDRAHRIGTKGTVNVVTILCKDTIDERINDVVYKKGKMSDMLIDGKDITKDRDLVDYLLS